MDTTSVAFTEGPGVPDAEDRVVRELDVFLVQGELQGTQSYLLQYPLRPPWRSYHEEGLHNVRIKPKVKKLECEAPLDTTCINYTVNAEPSRLIRTVPLQSSRLEKRADFLIGWVEQDQLLLFPVDEALQLRPSLAYLDKEKELTTAAKKRLAAEEEEEQKPEMLQLTVQVKRRETEQQAEARLRSYAHLAAQEEADAWVPLNYHGSSSDLAIGVWKRLSEVEGKGEAAAPLSRAQYFDAVVPGSSAVSSSQESAGWAAGAMAARDLGRPAALGAAAARGGAANNQRQQQQQQQADTAVPPELQKAVVSSAAALLKQLQVANIDAIRSMMARVGDAATRQLAASASDAALHKAIVSSGEITHIRKAYFPTRLHNSTLDPLRDVLVELLKGQEQVRRSDIMEAAKVKGLAVSDTLYAKVVKELCASKGAVWSLKC